MKNITDLRRINDSKEDRINAAAELPEWILSMSEGNPGAAAVLMNIIKHAPEIDVQTPFPQMIYLMYLDDLRIYGKEIWLLYKAICKENIPVMLGLINAVYLNLIDYQELKEAIALIKKGDLNIIDAQAIYAKFCQLNPYFNPQKL